MAESYTKNGLRVTVHFRERGQVYGVIRDDGPGPAIHAAFFRMDEPAFEEQVKDARCAAIPTEAADAAED